ncbi:hypothetical protein HPB47_015933 [Ixodes persulcatus]|uniref:Uncharacterized protein n=1 Tax=Ixodes persulcatus TaxID=34615 RepID=A0AC60QS48_IXOPE|nr:hypothetical protein HPB47_015933 [Ixodes persulcatus]
MYQHSDEQPGSLPIQNVTTVGPPPGAAAFNEASERTINLQGFTIQDVQRTACRRSPWLAGLLARTAAEPQDSCGGSEKQSSSSCTIKPPGLSQPQRSVKTVSSSSSIYHVIIIIIRRGNAGLHAVLAVRNQVKNRFKHHLDAVILPGFSVVRLDPASCGQRNRLRPGFNALKINVPGPVQAAEKLNINVTGFVPASARSPSAQSAPSRDQGTRTRDNQPPPDIAARTPSPTIKGRTFKGTSDPSYDPRDRPSDFRCGKTSNALEDLTNSSGTEASQLLTLDCRFTDGNIVGFVERIHQTFVWGGVPLVMQVETGSPVRVVSQDVYEFQEIVAEAQEDCSSADMFSG